MTNNIGRNQPQFYNQKKISYHSRGIKIGKIESDWRPIIFSGSHFCLKKKLFVKNVSWKWFCAVATYATPFFFLVKCFPIVN